MTITHLCGFHCQVIKNGDAILEIDDGSDFVVPQNNMHQNWIGHDSSIDAP